MIIDKIETTDIDKIFCNSENKKAYIKEIFKRKNEKTPPLSKLNKNGLNKIISDTWMYDESKEIIRKIFEKTDKYKNQKKCKAKIDTALKNCIKKCGNADWPFSATDIDQRVHKINRENWSETKKDKELSKDMIKFRRVKDINMLRNDYIEALIFENENVIPTLGNKASIDFYINGEPYDQKVSRSVGKEFINKYGEEKYRKFAIKHPEKVAQSLYENQNDARFGAEPRLLIVYLDQDITSDRLEEQIKNYNFEEPKEIDFIFKNKKYSTKYHMILLHN